LPLSSLFSDRRYESLRWRQLDSERARAAKAERALPRCVLRFADPPFHLRAASRSVAPASVGWGFFFGDQGGRERARAFRRLRIADPSLRSFRALAFRSAASGSGTGGFFLTGAAGRGGEGPFDGQYWGRVSSSGSLAMFAAIRRAYVVSPR
jgi:hypothetical protein